MSLCGSEEDKKRLMLRLKKIEGQVRGIQSMVEKDRDCIEVLRQINSAIGALRGVWTQAVGDHLRGCVSEAAGHHADGRLVDELIEHLKQIK